MFAPLGPLVHSLYNLLGVASLASQNNEEKIHVLSRHHGKIFLVNALVNGTVLQISILESQSRKWLHRTVPVFFSCLREHAGRLVMLDTFTYFLIHDPVTLIYKAT